MILQISSDKLSFGTQGDDVARVHQALLALGRDVPGDEITNRVFGVATTAVVKALQTDFGAPSTGVVDAATVRAINGMLANLNSAGRVVRGFVYDANAKPFNHGLVQLYIQGFDGERGIGTSSINEVDGSYHISYETPPGSNGHVNLRVAVLSDDRTVETTPSGANILTDAGPLEVVNFVLSGAANQPKSEYDLMLEDINPLLGKRRLRELKEDAKQRDVSLLASKSGFSSAQIATLALAHKLEQETQSPAPMLYGLLSQGLPSEAFALHGTDRNVRLNALKAAVEKGVVPREIDGRKIEDYLDGLTPSPAGELQGLFGGILNANEVNLFVGAYLRESQNPDAFWNHVATDPMWASRANRLKLRVQIGSLTNNHVPLVIATQSRPDITRASDLVRLSKNDWKTLVNSSNAGVPPDTPGANAEEKTNNYVEQVMTQIEAAFPTQFFAARLGPSPVATYLNNQPSYNLEKTYPAQFFKSNPNGVTPEVRAQLPAFQRLYRLTGRAEETLALSARGIHSAQQISRIDREAFAKQLQNIVSEPRANEIYDKALRTNTIALALLGEHGASFNQTGLQALPKTDIRRQADTAKDSIPDWETLFGALDFCACRDCASAHGPAAYFVDLLMFLKDRKVEDSSQTVKDLLFRRRPDLGDIELSCENTNTPLPFIDLVNEVLENVVAPPLPFSQFNPAPELEDDLAQTMATDALRDAFQPALRAGARVEILEAGKRWRVLDEPFAYSILKNNNVLTVVARSRQTTGSAAERRATPQYRNSAAYSELSQSVYPWNLPFDLSGEESSLLLTHLGVSRCELIEAMRQIPEPFDPNAPVVVSLTAERLGLTDMERRIIVNEPLTPPRPPEEFWGGTPVTLLTTVQELLDRAGLSYAELDALLATRFISLAAELKITAKPGAPVDTCDTTKLQIIGLTAEVLTRMTRFVRLWRKLGWTISEVDRAIRAFEPNPVNQIPGDQSLVMLNPEGQSGEVVDDDGSDILTNETLVKLDHLRALCSQLRLSVAQALAFWKPVDTVGPDSLYHRLFCNPAVFNPPDEGFRLRSDGRELIVTRETLASKAGVLKAAFRLDSAGLSLLIARTDGLLNLANLSLVYRHATLARQLSLTVQDLLTAIDLTGIDPFRVENSQDTLRFIEVVKAILTSGFDFSQLDYLLRHRFNPASSFVPTDSTLAQTLLETRSAMLRIDAPSEIEKQKLRQSAVIDRIAAALGLPADVTAGLLMRVTHSNIMTALSQTALQTFIELSAITAESLSRNNAGPQFETLEKLLKIAAIIQTLKLPGSQLNWLFLENSWLAVASDPLVTHVSLANWFSIIRLKCLEQDLALEDAALEAILSAISAAAAAAKPTAQLAARKTLIDSLSRWLGWPQVDLETLIGRADKLADTGLLKARIPDDYRVELIHRLNRAMNLLKRLGVTAEQANEWCDPVVTDANAKAIRGAAKAKYDDDAWQKIAVPLQNSLRDKQREALVGYLVARPAKWTANTVKADANDLYSHFLIDVEMSSCQLTSRIKQAIGSVQLFAQRCLMGLEPDVQPSDPKWTQWNWMKNFRVWEANRKIWLYPENWIEPELRDDKTPFFKDLESELMQSDLDDSAAEQAFLNYLEKLDEVARLEIVGVYEDEETRVLHVFGRTFNAPHIYYYRRREGVARVWKPWEKVELDIEGEHLIPVIWNRKLMLIWPIFTEKAEEKQVVMPQPGNKLESANRYWEIQLAWSEYQNGRWSGKNLSKAVTLSAYQNEDKILFGERVAAPTMTPIALRRRNDGDGGVLDIPDTDGDDDVLVDDTIGHAPPRPSSSTGPRRLISRELISFKALVSGDTLAIRGFLRRDYRGTSVPGDSQIAYPFGEFRFFGCRKIVTTAHNSQIEGRNFALAPKGTKFDRMWFTGTGAGLILFDGEFPVLSTPVLPTISNEVNEPASIAGDPSHTLVNKVDIPALDQTPWPFRLLAPHQDLQFIGDRPFVFMDNRRTFIVSSTGTSGIRARPDLGGWVGANLATAWRSDFFPQARPALTNGNSTNGIRASADPSVELQPLTVLAPGLRGRRVVKRIPPVSLTAVPSPRTILPVFWTTREYRFENFHQPYLCEFIKTLNRRGVTGLLSLETQSALNAQSFDVYQPKARVLKAYPVDEVEFQSGRAYELYNWELFFHIPLLIADRLSKNQRFEDARRWFHFIFDPTAASGGAIPQRYWRTKPFHDRLKSDYEVESVKTLEKMIADGPSEELKAAVETWRSNPFSPHAVARLRTTAYQKTVVMKYIDNLIAWGDQLFRRETLESINEATQLYVLAAEILGRRPEVIERNLKPAIETFNSLETKVGSLSNALEQIESLIADVGEGGSPADSTQTPDPPSDKVLYFCVPENDKLLGYWSTVADRLFKIRHCMNIDGQARQLPLFEPPIDPALLVRAQAAGLSIGDLLNDISTSLPNYRFSVMLQKANEVVAEVRNLGMGLLSVLEKRDAEALSTLRSGQELKLMQAVRDLRVNQIAEAKTNIAVLERSRELAQARKDYYESREFISTNEKIGLVLSAASKIPLGIKAANDGVATVAHLIPEVKIGSPTTAGPTYGGPNMAKSAQSFGNSMQALATIMDVGATIVNRIAEYDRRRDDWEFQANLAAIELKQIDRQLAAAQIRVALSEQELRNHDRQIDNAREVDQFLRGKFSNHDLYQWMIGQVSSLYFQSYQLAYDLAKRAELCMQHELGLKYGETSFIRFGYWDSLKKGLLAGDHLAYDLKRLDVAYLDGNIREYELTKHISLISLAPEQLIALKETGTCEFEIPEWLFDLDTPGHYRRRIRMVSLTIPCVTGPYTTIHCKARLVRNSYRQNADLAGSYDRQPSDDPAGSDDRFVDDRKVLESIVTSTGQNDAGLFEPGMRDERYLPFEGAGAISSWRLELPVQFKTFDYNSISDVILHMRYTARDGGEPLRVAATSSVTERLENVTSRPLFRLFSLRHEFPSEWYRFVNSSTPGINAMTVDLAAARFPSFVQNREIAITKAQVIARTKSPAPVQIAIIPGQATPDPTEGDWTGAGAPPGPWTLGTSSDSKLIEDIFVILAFGVS
ncbi:MAG: neuraminidase-like domain-containing protein [Blastocatellia bacterium]